MYISNVKSYLVKLKEKSELEVFTMAISLYRLSQKRIVTLIPQMAFTAFIVVAGTACMMLPASASDVFDIAKTAMQSVYKDVAGIATVVAVVCSAVCLFLMNFSKSGKTVDESRAWLKRIIVCWAALMTLGAIVTYMERIIPKSEFNG